MITSEDLQNIERMVFHKKSHKVYGIKATYKGKEWGYAFYEPNGSFKKSEKALLESLNKEYKSKKHEV